MTFRNFFLVLLLASLSLACKEGGQADTGSIIAELKKSMEEMKRSVTDSELDSMAADEVEKLFTFEYTVKDVPPTEDAISLNSILEEMGRERWNCFHIEEKKEYIRLYCKRRPKTYLRYVPRFF
jgi:hypothetical protein